MPAGTSGSLTGTSLTYLSLVDANPSKPPGNCAAATGRCGYGFEQFTCEIGG